jgi:PHD/YefM family antitoxin component YafN of YafNO toxin-antitoxin module
VVSASEWERLRVALTLDLLDPAAQGRAWAVGESLVTTAMGA